MQIFRESSRSNLGTSSCQPLQLKTIVQGHWQSQATLSVGWVMSGQPSNRQQCPEHPSAHGKAERQK